MNTVSSSTGVVPALDDPVFRMDVGSGVFIPKDPCGKCRVFPCPSGYMEDGWIIHISWKLCWWKPHLSVRWSLPFFENWVKLPYISWSCVGWSRHGVMIISSSQVSTWVCFKLFSNMCIKHGGNMSPRYINRYHTIAFFFGGDDEFFTSTRTTNSIEFRQPGIRAFRPMETAGGASSWFKPWGKPRGKNHGKTNS